MLYSTFFLFFAAPDRCMNNSFDPYSALPDGSAANSLRHFLQCFRAFIMRGRPPHGRAIRSEPLPSFARLGR